MHVWSKIERTVVLFSDRARHTHIARAMVAAIYSEHLLSHENFVQCDYVGMVQLLESANFVDCRNRHPIFHLWGDGHAEQRRFSQGNTRLGA
jgi:hypothetical protein